MRHGGVNIGREFLKRRDYKTVCVCVCVCMCVCDGEINTWMKQTYVESINK